MRTLLLFTLSFILFNANLQSQITWGATSDVALSSFGNDHPRVVMDASANALAIWNSAGDAMFSRWNGTNFTTPIALNPVTVSIAGASWMGPDIASHGDTVYVVYKETPENLSTSNIYCMSSFDGGQSFSSPVQVNNIGSDISRFPTVTTDDLGNPIIAFMKFNSSFANAEWVVAKSTDFGISFAAEVLASGWSSPTSEVCDCCPGSITSLNGNLAMLYRDNNSNIRDNWVGVSTNNGTSFTGGMNVDQQNWLLLSCPSTGPDGFIIGDTVYSSFMNGTGGMNLVYYNKNSISTLNGSAGIPATGAIAGLTQQNYSRIANSGNAAAMVWKQVISGNSELPLLFTTDIKNGFTAPYNTIASSNVTNTDVDLQNGNIIVLWQDNNAGTVKYRMGTYNSGTSINERNTVTKLSVYPNPVFNTLTLDYDTEKFESISLTDAQGKLVSSFKSEIHAIDFSNLPKGIYFVNFNSGSKSVAKKIIKN